MGSIEIWPGQTGLQADGQKFLGKSPWQQSHPLKIALVGFSFHFSIGSFSIQFAIAAKSLGMPTSVHRKVRGGFLYFFKACWGDWEFSPGFLKLLWDPKEKRVLFYRSTSYFCYITNIDLLDSKYETYVSLSTASQRASNFLWQAPLSCLCMKDVQFFDMLHLLLPFLFHIPTLSQVQLILIVINFITYSSSLYY